MTTLLGYGEPQILEVFRNTLPTKLYWVQFPIDDLRQAVETAKRILTKEKIDRQLAVQSSTTLFMSIKHSYNNKKPTFNMQHGLEDKIERLMVMMNQLTTKDEGLNKQIKPKIYQGRRDDRVKNFMIDIFMIREVIKIDIDQKVKIEGFNLVAEHNMDRITEVDQCMNKIIEMTIEEVILKEM